MSSWAISNPRGSNKTLSKKRSILPESVQLPAVVFRQKDCPAGKGFKAVQVHGPMRDAQFSNQKLIIILKVNFEWISDVEYLPNNKA